MRFFGRVVGLEYGRSFEQLRKKITYILYVNFGELED